MTAAFDGTLSKYRLFRQLGRGGFGTAFLAEHENGLQCVVKLFHGLSAARPADLRRLEISLARMQTVQSPQVAQIIDAGIDPLAAGGPQPWIAMPYLRGTIALDQALRERASPADPRWAHAVICDVLRGLQALHDVGLLHRDLKPSNILVSNAGRAWLIDFDLVKVTGIASQTPASHRMGTLPWMAPEQTVGPVGRAADLWAFGLIVQELLTGQQPLMSLALAGRDHELMQAITAESLVSPQLPPSFKPLISALLRKMPAARPQTAQQVLAWLQDPDAVTLSPSKPLPRPQTRWTIGCAAEVDAVERARPLDVQDLDQLDVTVQTVQDVPRLRAAADALGLRVAYETAGRLASAAPSMSLFDDAADTTDPASESPVVRGDVALLPFRRVDDIGVEAAIDRMRDAKRAQLLVTCPG